MQRDKLPLRDRGHGRWPQILAALGVPAASLNIRKHGPCPWCGGKDRFRFTDVDGSGKFFCGQCGSHGPVDYLMQINGWDFAKAAKEIEDVLGEVKFSQTRSKTDSAAGRASMQALWDRGREIVADDFVDRWFAGRGVRQGAYCRWLRAVDSAEHVDEDGRKTWHPVMVAKVLAPNGTPTNLHRTYLTQQGQKATVDPVRKTMVGGIAKGSAIRLFEPGPVLGIAEGIETAFAASEMFRVPVWAAMNSTLLSGWEPPEGVQQILVFGDNDPKYGGQAAAYALAHKLSCRGISASLQIPPNAGDDWNDVLLAKRSVAA